MEKQNLKETVLFTTMTADYRKRLQFHVFYLRLSTLDGDITVF